MNWFGTDLVVAGHFTRIGGVQATNVALWDGLEWAPLGSGLGVHDAQMHYLSAVNAIRVIDNEIYAAGFFTNSGAMPVTNIAKWTGTEWVPIGFGKGNLPLEGTAGFVSVIDCAGRAPDDLYVVGNFRTAAGAFASGIAHWNGEEWLAVGSGVTGDPNMTFISALALAEADVFVGGAFTAAGSIGATNVAKWTGSGWEPLGAGLGPPSQAVYALASSGGRLYAGGSFGHAPGASVRGVAQWDGSAWEPVGGLLSEQHPSYVVTLKPQGNGLVIGGEFGGVAGIVANNIARWTGSEWTALGSGLHSGPIVRALETTRSAIYAGGDFSMAGTVPSMGIAKWHIPQTLELESRGDELRLSWPAADANFILEASGTAPSSNWSAVESPPALVQGRLTVTNQVGSSNQFYRLREKTVP